MAKIILPCMSIEAHGRIGPGIHFQTNPHGQIISFNVFRPKPPTTAQKKVRNAYGEIATLWRGMTYEEKYPYIKKGRHFKRTGYNQFFKETWGEIYEP